ncbi:potassium-transporting ATPase subunit F [Fischerella thermalis]|jgi:K+-transporting ATPase KdpF subunit|uniref:K+-transporting ATPase, F subunit n=1 Tax=Fischerella thermalis JSC-11 TaxID=741277 RepID=G6FNI5_9CYAN|nr:potassium-transporting ATPase subunit F [Fischerella thermalis]PLZ77796.1 ATPase [Fischerella thermalis WC217]PMB08655.1 potassium-transporting ATPase subunit F [Fischerella thermalis CCMEE 5273]EHC19615.1 K+-transporting ATPase, F subunit [Fischerella thermalis JSC-11]PLZ09992.1 ATPase [Fischerella thermalis WC114]PLZ13432.1 ATPase [Fischerella thermalis WC119]
MNINKKINIFHKILSADIVEPISFIWTQWRKQKLPLVIFISLCLNLVIAPAVYAVADGVLERRSAWAIGILGFITLALVFYLFFVIFQPERF